MDCSKCGTYLWEADKPCPNCGATLNDADSPASPALTGAIDDGYAPAAAPTATMAPPTPWQPARPYKPSGRTASGGIARIMLTALISGLIVGLIYHYITKVLNIFLFMPIIGGVIVGAVIGGAVTKARCRNPLIAVVAGLLGGLLGYGGDIVMNAVEDRPAMVDMVMRDLVDEDQVPEAQARQLAERLLTPWRVVRFEMRVRAASGVSISHYGTGGLPITGAGYYAIVLLETVLFAGFAAALPLGAAKKRYCETCEQWHKTETAFTSGLTAASNMNAAVHAHDWQGADAVGVQTPVLDKAHVSVDVDRCTICNDATIKGTTTDGKNSKTMFEYFLPIEDIEQLVALGKLKPTQAKP